jgi:transcriptional regulator with XRE-family HTH domain
MNDETSVKVGERLAILRKGLGVSQRAMGELLGIPWRSLQNWEAAKREVSATALTIFAEKLRWNPYWILTGEGSQRLMPCEEIVEAAVLRVTGKLEEMRVSMPRRKMAELTALVVKRHENGDRMSDTELETNIMMGRNLD